MLAELDEDERAQPAIGQPRGKQSDGSRDHPVAAKAAQAAGDRRRRKRDVLGKGFGGAAVVTLDEVEQGKVEAIEHARSLPNFGIK